MAKRDSFVGALVKGGLAGVAGTFAMSAGMQRVPKMLAQAGMAPPKRGESTGVGGGKNSAVPVEKLATKISEGVLDTHLNRDEKKAAGQALHWAYGIGWGAYYGAVQNALRLPSLLHGTLLAGLMTLVASTLMPSLKIVPPPTDLPVERSLLQALYVLMFSWVTAIVFGIISRKK